MTQIDITCQSVLDLDSNAVSATEFDKYLFVAPLAGAFTGTVYTYHPDTEIMISRQEGSNFFTVIGTKQFTVLYQDLRSKKIESYLAHPRWIVNVSLGQIKQVLKKADVPVRNEIAFFPDGTTFDNVSENLGEFVSLDSFRRFDMPIKTNHILYACRFDSEKHWAVGCSCREVLRLLVDNPTQIRNILTFRSNYVSHTPVLAKFQ